MKILDLEQGSPAWHAWRKTVITATDCPAIMGTSPWTTEYKCWQKKLGLIEDQASNDAMERGKRLEPIIRERFIKKYSRNMMAAVVESSEYEFLGASLDGISDGGKYILEIKTGKKNLYDMALAGIIPPYYLDQIQQQLLVTNAEKCFYTVGGEEEDKDVVIEVYPDPDFVKTYLPHARAFWKCVAFNEAPPLKEKDYLDRNDDLTLQEDLKAYDEVDAAIKALEEKKNERRKKIIERCGDQSSICQGKKIIKMIMKGRIDYEKIPEIKNIDLGKYRKDATTIWKIV